MIKLKFVSYTYNTTWVLKDINVELTENRIGIIGGNGCGKTTFAKLLNGLLLPSSGEVLVDGLNTYKYKKIIKRKVGFIFQDPDNQIVFPTVEEDLMFGMKNIGLSKEIIIERTREVLKRYNLWSLRYHNTHLLSGGEKQLLAIAGVLVMEPDYIVFDEPTTSLDLRNKKYILEVINQLTQRIIVISHDLDIIGNFERILVLESGRLIIDDIPSVALPEYRKMMS